MQVTLMLVNKMQALYKKNRAF